MFDDSKKRWQFALEDDEQRFETSLVSQRRLFNQVALYPVNFMHDRLLRPDRPVWGMFGQAAAWRFVDQWLLKATGGQLLRSVTTGYDKRESYTRAKDTASSLISTALSVESWDDGNKTLSHDIKIAKDHPMYQMLDASTHAGDMIDQFMKGDLSITPSNVAMLEKQCHTMAALARERISFTSDGNVSDDTTSPTKQIRDMLEKPSLHTAHDIQLMLSMTAALVADSSLPFSSEIYIPQEDIYLSQAESSELINYIQKNQPPANASPEQVRTFATNLKTNVVDMFGARLPKLLHFADTHLDMLDHMLVPDQKTDIQSNALANTLELQQHNPTSQFTPWNTGGEQLGNASTTLSAMRNYVFRPEAGHEVKKLYGRSFANQVLALPTSIVEEIVRNFFETSQPNKPKSGFDALIDRVQGNQNVESKALFNKDHFKRTLRSKGFHFIAKPLAASGVTVGLKESVTGWKPALAIEYAHQAHTTLQDAIHHTIDGSSELKEHMQHLGTPHPALLTLLEQPENKELLGKLQQNGSLDNAQEYEDMAELFDTIGKLGVRMSEELWSSMLKPNEEPSITTMIDHLAHNTISTAPEAMLSFAFIDTFIQASEEAHAMSEFMNPKHIPLDASQTTELAKFVNAQARAAGIANNPSADTMIRFANVVMDKAKDMGVMGRLEAMLDDSFHNQTYSEHVASKFVDSSTATLEGKQSDAIKTVRTELTQPWQKQQTTDTNASLPTRISNRWKQPEVAHEMQKLHDRQKGEKGIGSMSSIVENSLRHGNALFDRGNLVNAAWQYLVHPYVYGHGIVHVKEAANEALFHTESITSHAGHAMSLLNGLQATASKISPDLEATLSNEGIANAAFVKLHADGDLHNIPLIVAKPQAERSAQDTATMGAFFTKTGDAIMQSYAAMSNALLDGKTSNSMSDVFNRVMNAPVENLHEAVLGAGFTRILLQESIKQMGVLHYMPNERLLLSRKELADIGDYINHQAEHAGLAIADSSLSGAFAKDVSPNELVTWDAEQKLYTHSDAQTLTRFNNVVTERIRQAVKNRPSHDFIEQVTKGKQSEKLIDQASEEVIAPLSR